MANDGWHGGDRHDARGKNRSPNQGVDQGRFAPLELTNASDIEAAFRNPLGHGASIAGGVLRAKLVGNSSQPQECGISFQPLALISYWIGSRRHFQFSRPQVTTACFSIYLLEAAAAH